MEKGTNAYEREILLWYCREEVKEFGSITAVTLAECTSNGITLDDINEAIKDLGVTIN